MKHAIYSCLAFVAILLTLTACSNDAIDIEYSERADITLSIDPSQVYTTFDCTYGITTQILGGYDNAYIGVFSLLYDSEGNLVDSINSYSRSLSTMSQHFEAVEVGTYTLVCVQTVVWSDEDYASEVWGLTGIEKLSTLLLANAANDPAYWYEAVGLVTKTLTVGSAAQTLSITPQAIGSKIKVEHENLASTDYICVCMSVKNRADGRYLDPSLSESSVWYFEDYNAQNTWSLLGYVYDSNGVDDDDSWTTYSLQTGEQTFCFGFSTAEQLSDGGWYFDRYGTTTATFEDGGVYLYYAYYIDEDNVEAYFGDYDDTSSFNSWYAAVVEEASSNGASSSDVLDVPCTNWGASVSTVKSYMSGYTLEYEDDSFLSYYGQASSVDDIYYYFDESYGLYMGMVWVYSSALTNYEIAEELTNLGYTYLGENTDDDGNALLHLISNDYDTYVWVVDYTYTDDYSEWMVEFYSYELLSTKERSASQSIELIAPKELKGRKTKPNTSAQYVSAPASAGTSSRPASLRLQQHAKAVQ